MKQELIITTLILVILAQYYQQKKTNTNFSTGTTSTDENESAQTNQTLITFLRNNLNSNSLEELQTKLAGKNLEQILEANEDYETEVDNLTRTKNSLEADLLAQSNAFQNRLREKEREIKKFKEDLNSSEKRLETTNQKFTSEKQQHKGSLERISLLAEQISQLKTDQAQKERAIIGLNNSYEKLEQKHQQKLTVLTQQLHHSQTTTELSAKKINSLENQLISLAKQKIANKKEALELVKQLETRLAEKESVWQSEKKDLENKIQQITEVPDSWKDINTKFEDLKEEATVREKQFLELVKKDFDNLVENNKELTQKLEQQTKKEVDLEDTIIRLTQSMADLNKELDKEEATPEEVD